MYWGTTRPSGTRLVPGGQRGSPGGFMSWFEKYGWRSDPFDPDLPDPRFLVYRELSRRLVEKLRASRTIWLWGNMGLGKTTILRWIEGRGRALGLRVLYLHYGRDLAKLEPRERAEFLLAACERAFRKDIFQRLRLASGPRNVLLIDEAGFIENRELPMALVGLLDDAKVHPSIVFASIRPLDQTQAFYDSFRDRRVDVVALKPAEVGAVKEMVKKRIESVGGEYPSPFSERVIEAVCEREGLQPRMVLQALQVLAEHFAETHEHPPEIDARRYRLVESEILKKAVAPAARPQGVLALEAPTPESERVLRALTSQQRAVFKLVLSDGPVTPTRIREKLGMKGDSARKQLSRLASEQEMAKRGLSLPVVTRDARGRYEVPYSIRRLFGEE